MSSTSGVAWKSESMKDAAKDFVGTIVEVDYGTESFGMKGDPSIGSTREQVCFKIESDKYDKPQYAWFPPSDVRLTKWAYLIEALEKTGAIKEIVVKGVTDEEKIKSFAQSMLGMEFRWIEYADKVSITGRKVRVTLPIEYKGKKALSGSISEKTVSDQLA